MLCFKKPYIVLLFLGDFLLPSSSGVLGSHTGHKMHLDPLISFDSMGTHVPMHHSSSMMMNPGGVGGSPISSPGLMSPPSTAVESRIFQFPPTNPSSNSNQLPVKQEEWSCDVPCLQDTPTSAFPPGPISSAQGSPMAISPTMSTLNTPRGSITSMRSQQSPMDSGVPAQQPQQPLADPMMSSYDAFDAATAFVSYTTVTHQNFPSPPGSPRDQVVSSTTSSNFEQQNPSNFGNYYSPSMMQVQGATSNQDLPIFNAISMKTEQVRT